MTGTAVGTNGESPGTSGGNGVTGGNPATLRRIGIGVLLLLGIAQTYANGVSRMEDLRGAGKVVNGWHVAIDEASSLVALFLLLPLIWRLVERVRPPRLSWPVTFALHLAASVAVSFAHVALFVLLRHAAHALDGSAYSYTSDWGASLLYEYRKDAVSYVLLALAMAAIQWVTRTETARQDVSLPPAPPMIIEVGDGTVTHRIPVEEIEWVEAAGNYVTLHWSGGTLLHRSTLAALDEELGEGFVRIHRSRLVRRAAVRRVETGQSGDFTVSLAGGTILRGSRRFRSDIRAG